MKRKNIKISIIIPFMALLWALASPAAAQLNTNTNYFLLWGSGGYSAIKNDAPATSVTGNAGMAIGGGYEMHFGNFLIQTGLEFSYFSSDMRMKDTVLVLSMVDTEGDAYNGHFAFAKIKDRQQIINVGIPLMFGYESATGIYFAVGGKAMLNMIGRSTVTSQVTSTAVYTYLIGDEDDGTLSDMPNHGLTTVSRTVKSSVQLRSIFTGSVEAGYTFGKNPDNHSLHNKPKIRLSLFCDYGFAPVSSKDKVDNLFVDISKTDEVQPAIRGYLLHNITSDRLNVLYAGLKITILFGSKKYGCNCSW